MPGFCANPVLAFERAARSVSLATSLDRTIKLTRFTPAGKPRGTLAVFSVDADGARKVSSDPLRSSDGVLVEDADADARTAVTERCRLT